MAGKEITPWSLVLGGMGMGPLGVLRWKSVHLDVTKSHTGLLCWK